MINREDIKEGLKFRLPNNKIERKYQVASFCLAMDMCESIQYLTTLKTPGGDKNYVTPKVPLFEVCGGPKLISSADKNDPHRAWVGEYIKVRSDAIWKKPLYISLSDVMQRGLVDNKTLKDVLRNEREGKSARLIPKKCVAFRDITNDMYDTFKAKNHDYDNSFSELFAECGMTYAYGHLSEKLKRVKSLMSDEAKVKDESMRDSLLDLANYAILTIMELDKTSMPKNAPAEEKYDWYGSPANIERILQREFNNEMQKND
ncbi:nucleotide modification associated domain-containing protein [Leyella stercorea]|uniref:nucleotide modification associated domain-containing protein n=1 Tax=Leyella stercorea TaxID=363265 RepID=UPI003AAD5593